VEEDRLGDHWYAAIWLSLLVPLVGTWVIVVLSTFWPVEEDLLGGYWYAATWLSLLVPLVGAWVIVVLSTLRYYHWRREYPRKARAINLHGWLAFLTAHTVCCLGWIGISALGLLLRLLCRA
jgi:hypothetical protein